MERRHGRSAVRIDPLHLVFGESENIPLQILQVQVKIASAADESTQAVAVAQLNRHEFVACGSARVGLEQRPAYLFGSQSGSGIGKIGADSRPASLHHVTGCALPFTEKELFSRPGVPGQRLFRGRCV